MEGFITEHLGGATTCCHSSQVNLEHPVTCHAIAHPKHDPVEISTGDVWNAILSSEDLHSLGLVLHGKLSRLPGEGA